VPTPDFFNGFPSLTFRFLRELECNNHGDWFIARQDVVEDIVLQPARAFVAVVGKRLQTIYPELVYDARTNGAGSMFRLNRDTRFSRDKSPYKTNLGFRFWLSRREREEKRAVSTFIWIRQA
jgi:uncharacterized protein (TIGR02453 family)